MLRTRVWRILVLLAVLPVKAVAQQPEPPAVTPPIPVSLPPVDPVVPAPPVEPPASPEPAPLPDAQRSPMGFSPFMGGTVGHSQYRADYRVTWFPDEAVSGQPTNLGYVQQDLGVSVPFWQDCKNEWTGHVNVRSELFHTSAVFPDTGQRFPEDLWNVRVGTTYRHLFDNGWIAGASVNFGSASDRPFNSINELTLGATGFLRIPQGDHNAWLFSLSYSPLSELPIPIPGVAFVWQPSDNFAANIGLPFLLMYRPIDDLTLDFSYMLLTNVHARATYRVAKPLHVYLGYDWSNESYYPIDRPDDRERLFYFDQRLTTGVRYNLNPHASFDLSGGYVFDRYYFEGLSVNDRNHNRIDVGDGPFVSLQFQARW